MLKILIVDQGLAYFSKLMSIRPQLSCEVEEHFRNLPQTFWYFGEF